MPTLRDRYLPVAYAKRAIAGRLGFRPHTVAIVNTAWSGDHVGDGDRESEVIPITEAQGQPPKVRWLNDEQRALAGAGVGESWIEVGPITPKHQGGGTDLSVLTALDLPNNTTHYVRITGQRHPTGVDYRIVEVRAERALRFMIRAKAVGVASNT